MVCVPIKTPRGAALLAALALAATLGACDFITGVEATPCALVPLDSARGVDSKGDSVKAVLLIEKCGGAGAS